MAATQQNLPGAIAGAYQNTGSYATPTWTEMTSVKGGTVGNVWGFGDSSKRATRAMLFDKTQVDLSSTLIVQADPAATDYVALYTAAHSPTSVMDLLLLNGKISVEGAIGIRSEFRVSLQAENQDMGVIIADTFDLKPTDSSNGVPGTVVMGAAGAPTITDL